MPPLCKGRCPEGAEGLSVGTSIARPGIDALTSVIPRSRERADEESPSLCRRLRKVWDPSRFALGMTAAAAGGAP